MQFENLKHLTIGNSDGLTLDFHEGILPLLQVCGPNLDSMILNKFECIDLVGKFFEAIGSVMVNKSEK